jgi:telomerase reverse transcriptase
MLSEDPSQPRTQATYSDNDISIDSAGRSIIAAGISFAEQQTKQKPRFAEFMCSYAEVFRFAVVVTKAVIPKVFWGSEKNFKIVTNCG